MEELGRVLDVPLDVRVEVARREMTIAELLSVVPGQVVMLNRLADGPIDVFAADKLIGHGEVVVIDEEFGVRLTELVGGADPAPSDGGPDDEPPAAAWGSRDHDATAETAETDED